MSEHGKLTARAAIASVSVACGLMVLKGYAAWTTESMAMLGSLADTALDLVASLVTLFGVRVAALPADHDHRFGHGKAEAIVALFQGIVIAGSSIAILIEATSRLSVSRAAQAAELGIGASAVAMAITACLLVYQRRVIAVTNSLAIRTDYVHYQSDLFLNLAVIVALMIQRHFNWGGADAVFGIGIALWLLRGAWRSGRSAIDQLMDKEWPEARRLRLVEVASACPGFINLHDLRTRSSGARDFAQFHIWVAGDMTIAAAHDVIERLEDMIEAEFPGTEVLIHLDPIGRIDTDNPLVEADQLALLKDVP
ncbi:cation diffusion facilitator family transporter [uncultured Sphingomonas sp.]|uniref:cation diffusion facilitator family transporter n=1 Tax=uncultured Sphingomonas sp. TaxID=158754 RepID=UPI0035CA0D58